MATFESMDRRMPKIEACLKANGLESLDACNEMLLAKGIDCDKIVRGVQPICFDNAVWAYTLGTAIAVKRGLTDAAECAAAIGEGLEAFTIPGSVAEQRQVGLGHGNLGARLLSEDTTCFAFLAGHESFAAAEGAIGIARTANKVRKTPLRVILNGLGKDAAYIISRINGFTYGIRAASKEEAELLLADMRRKEAAERDQMAQQRQLEEQERAQRRFEEESRRLGAQVAAANQRAEEEAQRQREDEVRRKEAQEKAQQEAELRKREAEIARFRSRAYQSDE
jgi:hypothetical protein